jgi:tetratricopeptide (TPR) repeat protein
LGRREDALRSIEAAIAANPQHAWNQYQQALIRLRLGDVDEYRAVCAAMLARFEGSDVPGAAWRTVEASVLLPAAVREPERIVQLGRQAVRLNPSCIARHTLGAALYRADRFEESLAEFDAARQLCRRGGTAWDFLFLAMANHRLSRHEEAYFWLDEAHSWLASAHQELPSGVVSGPNLADFDRVEFEVLLQEAEALVNKPNLIAKKGPTLLRRSLIQERVRRGDPDFTYYGARNWAGVIELPQNTLYRDRGRAAPPEEQAVWQTLTEEFSTQLQKDPTNARLWRAQGLACAALGRWNEAAAHFGESIKRNPNDREARRGRGRAYAELSQWEDAIADLTFQTPGTDDKEQKHERVADYLTAVLFAQAGNHEQAVAEFGRLTRNSGEIGWAVWGEYAQELAAVGDWKRALSTYTTALGLAPPEQASVAETLWCGRGQALGQLGRWEEAISDCNRALQHHPDNLDALRTRGIGLVNRGRFDDALKALTQVLDQQCDDVIALKYRGLAHSRRGDWKSALADADWALELNPTEKMIWRLKAASLTNLNQLEKAEGACSRLLDLEPNNAWAWCLRGRIRRQSGQNEKALADCDRALALEPDNGDALVVRGMAYSGLRQFDAAHKDFARAIALAPKEIDPLAQRATLLRYQGRLAEAGADLDRAVALKPENRKLRSMRGELFGEMGNWDQASKDFARAIELGSTSLEDFCKSMLIYRQQRDHERYARTCSTLFDKLTPKASAEVVTRAAQAAALGEVKISKVLDLMGSAADAQPKDAGVLQVHGAVLYRAGRFEEAVCRFEEVCQLREDKPDAFVLLFLAMARHRTGSPNMAKEALNQGISLARAAAKDKEVPWEERLMLDMLRREAESVVGFEKN